MVRELPQSSAFTLDDEEDVLELEHLVAKPRGLAGFAGQQLRTRKRLLGIVTGSVLLLTVVAVTVMTVSGFQTGSSSEEMDFEDIQGDSKPSFLGTGTCDLAQFDPEAQVSRVHCLSPKIAMARGQTVNAMMILANPFPIGEEVVMINQTAQMVDETLRPVPLTEVYVHHYVSSYRFLLGNGAELRGSMTRAPMPEPYAMMVNGTQVDEEHFRITNIQLINTDGSANKGLHRALMHPLRTNPLYGQLMMRCN
ncbi:hypothetical protein WJX84_005301 [Apatococcus fuscideae]|uniref:Uncharacterized protein n=1 Tax=Apatococcus fuscideae TaxID=2026836 RepID=A0AAW1RE70_9CHLO